MILFALIVLIEASVLKKSKIVADAPKKWIYKKIVIANLISSLAGVLILLFVEYSIPAKTIRARCGFGDSIMCDLHTPGSLFFPFNLTVAFVLNMIICFFLSFIAEYLYLKIYIKDTRLKKVVFLFNLFSYILMAAATVPLQIYFLS